MRPTYYYVSCSKVQGRTHDVVLAEICFRRATSCHQGWLYRKKPRSQRHLLHNKRYPRRTPSLFLDKPCGPRPHSSSWKNDDDVTSLSLQGHREVRGPRTTEIITSCYLYYLLTLLPMLRLSATFPPLHWCQQAWLQLPSLDCQPRHQTTAITSSHLVEVG